MLTRLFIGTAINDISGVGLSQLANLDSFCIRTGGACLSLNARGGADVAGKAVLTQPDWSDRWGTSDYLEGHPVHGRCRRTPRSGGAADVGIDSLNIDDIADGKRPVDTALLAVPIPIIEHLTNLVQRPGTVLAICRSRQVRRGRLIPDAAIRVA